MKINRIKETCIYAKDLELTRQFYEEKLGLDLVGKVEGKHVFFKAGNSMLLCFNPEFTIIGNELPPHAAKGIIHLAFEVGPEEYTDWKEKILSLGIEIIKEQEWKKGLKSFYFKDPDGHLLEILPFGIWD